MTLFPSIAIILGLGACQSSTDYCPDPVGKAAVELTALESDDQRHAVMFTAEHFSNTSDNGWLKHSNPLNYGDRGTELYFIQYRYQFKLR